MSPAEVLKLIKDNEVKFVDLRFTDTRGKEQHVSVPAKQFDNSKFEDGHAFDGSSIAGWKGIQASDMLLMPDAASVRMDPFTDEPTLIVTCDVVEPSDGKGYNRDPRSLAKRAEAYLQSTGIGDVCYFGPEPEFFIFDSVTWKIDMSGCSVKIASEEAPWSSGLEFEGGNMAHRPPIKGGYFPVAPVDSLQDIRSAMCLALEEQGVEVEVHHHEVGTAGQCEIAFFGLKSDFVGQGLGRDMMNAAIERAWRQPIDRLWVHTCSLDHPAALAFYRRSGFRVYRQQVEIAKDPRVLGELPRTAGAHVPIIE